MMRFATALGIVVVAALVAFALVKIHRSNLVARTASLQRLESAQSTMRAAGKRLTDEVAAYSSAHAEAAAAIAKPTGESSLREKTRAIARARAANENIAGDLQTTEAALAEVYGDAAVAALRAESALAHDTCARSLDDWVRGDNASSNRNDERC
ncbi:MAG: hypothetical protein JO199_07410, partial [Candidatus Eremiobacteraeota bacterium]|nr:hypothetical protein [Candidatus Eremiobacteraeota bacterium]